MLELVNKLYERYANREQHADQKHYEHATDVAEVERVGFSVLVLFE